MKSCDSGTKDVGFVSGFYDAMLEEEKKKLRIAKCSTCKKTIFYRLSTLGDSELHCKSCGAIVKVERYKKHPKVFR